MLRDKSELITHQNEGENGELSITNDELTVK